MMIFKLLAVVCFATSALAQICCTPLQWEATETVLENGHYNSVKKSILTVSYDAENNRTSVIQNVTSYFGHERRLQIISDYVEMKEYEIYLDEELCYTQDLRGCFQPFCIADGDTLLSSGELGIGDNTLSTKTYLQNDFYGYSEITVTEDCVPVIQTKINSIFRKKFETTIFSDITAAIADINIFTPPAFCNEVPLMERALQI